MDFSSAPFKLGLAVLGSCLAVLLIIRLLSRNKSQKTEANIQNRAAFPLSMTEPAQQPADAVSGPADLKEQGLRDYLKEIRTHSEILVNTAPSSDIREKGRHILTAAERAQNLLDNHAMLEADTATTPFKPINTDFHALIEKSAQKWGDLLNSNNVTFTHHIDASVPNYVYLDRNVINHILDSLLNTSQSATSKGRIHVHVTAEKIETQTLMINLIVADTGEGLPDSFKESLRHNKRMQAQNKEQLNLQAVSALSSVLKGKMNVNSVLGRGTEITLSFPARIGHATVDLLDIDEDLIRPGILQDMRVLVIEDDVSSQEVLRAFLTPEGCDIDCINDGSEALEALSLKAYDLVLMDIRMDGLDGIKTTQAIRSSDKPFKSVPIIAITADVDPDVNAKCMMAGADLFLNKPIGTKALFDGIRFVMDLGTEKPAAAIAASA